MKTFVKMGEELSLRCKVWNFAKGVSVDAELRPRWELSQSFKTLRKVGGKET